MIVSDPPSSMLRAAPKNCLGFWSAPASMPPERILLLPGVSMLWARARRVIESNNMTTSTPNSTRRFAFSQHHVRHLHVARGRLVEGRRDHFAANRPLHVGDFLGALIHEQHQQMALGIVGADRVRDLLEEDRLAGARRRHDQSALRLFRSARSGPRSASRGSRGRSPARVFDWDRAASAPRTESSSRQGWDRARSRGRPAPMPSIFSLSRAGRTAPVIVSCPVLRP